MTDAERVVTRARRGRFLFVAVFGLLAVGLLILFLRGESTRSAACVERPAGEACQKSKRESDRARTIRDTCIAFWRVGYACPAPDSGVTIRAVQGGDVPLPPATAPAPAGQPSAPGRPGDRGTPPRSGGDDRHEAEPDTSKPPPASTDLPTDLPTGSETPPGDPPDPAPPSAAPSPEPEPEVGLLGDPGGLLGDVVCTVNRLGIPVCTE